MRTYNVLVLGAGGVGKSAITQRYVNNEWNDVYDPTVEDSFTKVTNHRSGPVQLEIVDTAGYDQFTGFSDILINAADGFIIVVSYDSPESLELANYILTAIRRSREDEVIPVIVACNKLDLKENYDIQALEVRLTALAGRAKSQYVSCSARDNRNILRVFENLLDILVNQPASNPPTRLKRKKSASWWRKVFKDDR